MNYEQICLDRGLENLFEAVLPDVNLFEANLPDVDLSGAVLDRANLCRANLSRSSLFGARLIGANLSSATMTGANCFGADFTDADLSCAVLYGVTFINTVWKGANLSGALLDEDVYLGVNFPGAELTIAQRIATIDKIAEIVLYEKSRVEMSQPHSSDNVHSLGGWVCVLSKAAQALENRIGWNAAASLVIRIPEFTELFNVNNKIALNWLENEFPEVRSRYLECE